MSSLDMPTSLASSGSHGALTSSGGFGSQGLRSRQRFLYEELPTVPSLSVDFVDEVPYGKRVLILDLVATVNRLMALPVGWDEANGHPVSPIAGLTVINVANALLDAESLPPQVFPLTSGGIQLEWHVGGSSLEAVVTSDGDTAVLGTDPSGNEIVGWDSVEDDFQQGLTAAAKFLQVMTDQLATRRTRFG